MILGDISLFQYTNWQLYFTNNETSQSGTTSSNSGFIFRNRLFDTSYQTYLSINDLVGATYYNNNGLPILATGGLTFPASNECY